MALEFMNFIGGKWVKAESGETFSVSNPADASMTLGQFQLSSKEDAKKAIDAAKAAFPGWRNTPPPQRGRMLNKTAEIIESRLDEFARTLTAEEGKTLVESTGEVRRAADLFRFYAGQGTRLDGRTYPSAFPRTFLYSVREPLGVVALMTPWNFPIAIPSWKIAPALISGNCVVFKPASLTPSIAHKLVSALEESAIPPGVVNLVTGPGGTVGEELTVNRDVEAISFTGSYEVGYSIQRGRANSAKMARVQLEMGGKNPTIVLPDAKLDEAVEVVTRSAFGLTGQACTATSRVIVHSSIKEKFTEKLASRVGALRVGDGMKAETEMGPAVSRAELDKDLEYIEVGESEGAKLLIGGKRIDEPELAKGYFVEPTIFDGVFPDMRIAKEEIFGPVLAVMAADNVDQAVELANRSDFGLTAGICTTSLSSALEFADRAQVGIVKVNRPTTGVEYQAPFGGIKKSSSDTFKEQGEEGIDFYTRIKMVYVGY